jgi:hypothetical protein
MEKDGNGEAQVSGEEEYPSEDEYSDEGGNYSPGDGICPSTSQFNAVYNASYESWTSPTSETFLDRSTQLLCIDSFLELLKDTPPILDRPLDGLHVFKGCGLMVLCALKLETTSHPECDQSIKLIKYASNIASSKRKAINLSSCTGEVHLLYSKLQSHCIGNLTCLVLAWSYILCSRWVELLQNAGEDASLSQRDQETNNIWGLIMDGQWTATITRDKKTYYAPWMFKREVDNPTEGYAGKSIGTYCSQNGTKMTVGLNCMESVLMPPLLFTSSRASAHPMVFYWSALLHWPWY